MLKLRFICQYSGNGVAVIAQQFLLYNAKTIGLSKKVLKMQLN